MRPHVSAADLFEIWRKVVSPDAGCAARPNRSAEALLVLYGHFQLDCKVTWQESTARLPGKSLEKGWLFGRSAPMLVLPVAIWDHHRQQCEAPRGTAYLSTDIRPGDIGACPPGARASALWEA